MYIFKSTLSPPLHSNSFPWLRIPILTQPREGKGVGSCHSAVLNHCGVSRQYSWWKRGMKGRNWAEGRSRSGARIGEKETLSQVSWDLFVTRSPGRGVPPLACSLPEVGICCTCLATAGLVSFVQQIFTELLNPRAGLAATSLPVSEPQFYSSER